jgi:hypothetical protein
MEELRAKYPLDQLLHLLRLGKLKVPSGTTSRDVNQLLKDASFLQVCSGCHNALNTTGKKRDGDVPLFCACRVDDADVLFPERWVRQSWCHQRCVHDGKVRVTKYDYTRLPTDAQWCIACRPVSRVLCSARSK